MLAYFFDFSFKIRKKLALKERLNILLYNLINYIENLAIELILNIAILFDLGASDSDLAWILCHKLLDFHKA